MLFKFERLIIWQKAMLLGEEMNNYSSKFPVKEKFNLSSQLMRAIDSVALNIAEGSIVQSKPEFRKFLGYAIRVLAEVVTCLHKSKNREYISQKVFEDLYDKSFQLMNMMIGFRNKI